MQLPGETVTLLLIRQKLQLLRNAQWISIVKARTAFPCMRIRKGDEWKSAFRFRFGSFEWKVTPFGLAGAPNVFQRWIKNELSEFLGEFFPACFDDAIIFSDRSFINHWEKANKVLSRFADAGPKLDPEKYSFETKMTKYPRLFIEAGKGISWTK